MLTVLQVGSGENNGQQLILVAIYLFIIRYAVLVFDEMKIREDLVFNKFTGEIVGFVDFGENSMDKHFSALKKDCTMQKSKPLDERTLATHMLTVMVRGIFFHLNFPFAQFAATGIM